MEKARQYGPSGKWTQAIFSPGIFSFHTFKWVWAQQEIPEFPASCGSICLCLSAMWPRYESSPPPTQCLRWLRLSPLVVTQRVQQIWRTFRGLNYFMRASVRILNLKMAQTALIAVQWQLFVSTLARIPNKIWPIYLYIDPAFCVQNLQIYTRSKIFFRLENRTCHIQHREKWIYIHIFSRQWQRANRKKLCCMTQSGLGLDHLQELAILSSLIAVVVNLFQKQLDQRQVQLQNGSGTINNSCQRQAV